ARSFSTSHEAGAKSLKWAKVVCAAISNAASINRKRTGYFTVLLQFGVDLTLLPSLRFGGKWPDFRFCLGVCQRAEFCGNSTRDSGGFAFCLEGREGRGGTPVG